MKKMPTFIVSELYEADGAMTVAAVNVQHIAVIRMSNTEHLSEISMASGEVLKVRVGAQDMMIGLDMGLVARFAYVARDAFLHDDLSEEASPTKDAGPPDPLAQAIMAEPATAEA